MVKREGMENLLPSYYEGETTEDETALVEEWLEASEENRRTARQVQTLGLAADMAQISSRLDVKKALEDVHRKMKQKKVNRYQVLFRGMQRAAAILFIPLMVSWSILYWDKDKEEIHMMEVRTNPGMTTSGRNLFNSFRMLYYSFLVFCFLYFCGLQPFTLENILA